jgi:hypothetical protein
VGLFQNLLVKIRGEKPPVKKVAAHSDVSKPQTHKTEAAKPSTPSTLGHAPAQHPITQKELARLFKAASTEEVQEVIQNIVPIFHPELNNTVGQKRPRSKTRTE